ncbi:MAG: hypothetical protein NUV63_14590 [Gallionella sp.]|nr:hypothetical protein [Gallionella sp.]
MTRIRHLAHLLRLGNLPTGAILPPEQRTVRDLARKRMQLVRSRTAHILAVENITARQLGARISSNHVKQLTGVDVDLGFRLRLMGHRCLLVPRAVVCHIGSATTGGKKSDFAIYHGHRNLVLALCEEHARLVVLGLFAVAYRDEFAGGDCVCHAQQGAGDTQGHARCVAGFAADVAQA